jgi:hypothetical protein
MFKPDNFLFGVIRQHQQSDKDKFGSQEKRMVSQSQPKPPYNPPKPSYNQHSSTARQRRLIPKDIIVKVRFLSFQTKGITSQRLLHSSDTQK